MQHNDLEVAKAKQVAKELGQGQDGKRHRVHLVSEMQ